MNLPPWGPENTQHFSFGYDNALLSRLYLAPLVCFSIDFQVNNQKLDLIDLEMSSGEAPPHRYQVQVWEFPERQYPEQPGSSLTYHDQAFSVTLTPYSTPERRKQAYSFNLKCLDKIGGCRDEKELLPGPWETPK